MLRPPPSCPSHWRKAFQQRRHIHFLGAVLAATLGTTVAFSVFDQHQPPSKQQKSTLHRRTFHNPILSNRSIAKEISDKMRSILMYDTTLCAASMENDTGVNASMEVERVLPKDDPSSYYYEKMTQPTRSQAESHAIFGALRGQGYIERYDVYRRVATVSSGSEHTGKDDENNTNAMGDGKKEVMVADAKIGKNLNGHSGIVHGGIISLLMDDALGWGCEAMDLRNGMKYGDDDFPIVVTANLNIDFRNPLPAESSVVIRVYHDKTEGRKVYASSRMESHDGSVLFSEATVLFIIVPMSRLKNE